MDVINQLIQLGLYLNRNGLYCAPQKEQYDEKTVEHELQNLIMASRIVPFMVETSRMKALMSSYGLKHTVERALPSHYISNGDMILVMLMMGYGITKHQSDRHPNCGIKCKYGKSDYISHPGVYDSPFSSMAFDFDKF